MKLKVFVGGSFHGYTSINKLQYPQHGDEIIGTNNNKYVIYVVLGKDTDGSIVVGAKAVKPELGETRIIPQEGENC